MAWEKLTEKDCHELKLMTVDPKKGAPENQVCDLLCLSKPADLDLDNFQNRGQHGHRSENL